MTWQMALALTVPPSIAFVLERWMRGREEQARKLSADDVKRIKALEACDDVTQGAFKNLARVQATHEAELKRINEQVTTLSERLYQR